MSDQRTAKLSEESRLDIAQQAMINLRRVWADYLQTTDRGGLVIAYDPRPRRELPDLKEVDDGRV